MTDQERTELEWRLAMTLGDGAWEPAATCRHGHSNRNWMHISGYEEWIRLPGQQCLACTDELARGMRSAVDVAEIERQPKPLARSLDVLVSFVEAWCKKHEVLWRMEYQWIYADQPLYTVLIGKDRWSLTIKGCADTAVEALALALDAALSQEGREA